MLNIAAAAAAASTGSLHPPASSATISPLSSSILGSSRSSSLLSPPLIGKEEKTASGIPTSGLGAPCSSSHSIHAHPPVGAVGPMPHIGKNGILSEKNSHYFMQDIKLNVIVYQNIHYHAIFIILGPGASSGRREDSMDTDQKQVLEFLYICIHLY